VANMTNHVNDDHKQAYSIREFCARYGLGRQTIYDEINRGRLRVHKVGKRSLILRADERIWLDNLQTMVVAHTLAHTDKRAVGRQGRTVADGKKLKKRIRLNRY
jgi:excisionase family DNA binding protein